MDDRASGSKVENYFLSSFSFLVTAKLRLGMQLRHDHTVNLDSLTLYLILRSYFDDAEYEEPAPKFGHGSSGLDIKLPSVGIIVEAKFIRKASEFAKIEDEIKKTWQIIKSATPYRKTVVFIYDNTSSVQDHQTTIRALKRLDGIVDVIIVSKPSHIG